MLNIRKILLPADFPVVSLGVIHQAATLARHFNSEIAVLHVVTALSHAAGVPEDSREMADWDLLAAIIRQAEKQQDQSLGPELDGLTIQRKLVKGDAAVAIVQTAEEEKADLIMMPSHSFTFYQFLMGSVTAKVLHRTACPVWTGAHVAASPAQKFAIRNVLCAIDFGPRTHISVSGGPPKIGLPISGARLTLANVTAGVELWGPGGSYVDQDGKRSSSATLPSKWFRIGAPQHVAWHSRFQFPGPGAALRPGAIPPRREALRWACRAGGPGSRWQDGDERHRRACLV